MQLLRAAVKVVTVTAMSVGATTGSAMAQDEPPVVPNVEQELRVVRDVLSSTALESALGYVERAREETLQEFIGVCNAHGPSQDEMYRSRHLLKLLQIYGLQKVHIDDEKNVIGIRPGSGDGPTVVINAHHDNIAMRTMTTLRGHRRTSLLRRSLRTKGCGVRLRAMI
jgi:hypothetical protein